VESTFFERFVQAQIKFRKFGPHWLAEKPLTRWATADDRYRDTILARMSVRELLEKSFEDLERMRGVGQTKIHKCVEILERAIEDIAACIQIEESGQESPASAKTPLSKWIQNEMSHSGSNEELSAIDWLQSGVEIETLTESAWDAICRCINDSSLDGLKIGQVVDTHRGMRPSLLQTPVFFFTSKSLSEFYWPEKYSQKVSIRLLRIFIDLATIGSSQGSSSGYGLLIKPRLISSAENWLKKSLDQDDLPELHAIREFLISPILNQVGIDRGSKSKSMLKKRLGGARKPKTLKEIATPFGLTRERSRQILYKAGKSIFLRWPDGQHTLELLLKRYVEAGKLDRSVSLIRQLLHLIYAHSPPLPASIGEITQFWEYLAKQKKTPFTEFELKMWFGRRFRGLDSKTIKQQLRVVMKKVNIDSQVFYFSKNLMDQLLLKVCLSEKPLSLKELAEASGLSQKETLYHLTQDWRFFKDENKNFFTIIGCGLKKVRKDWHMELLPIRANVTLRQSVLTIDEIIAAAWGWLLKEKIHDLSAWGFKRLVDEQLQQLHNAKLPEKVTPFVLADIVVRQSNGMVRHRRRHRLCWSASLKQPGLVLGKDGWAVRVLQEYGKPIMALEIGPLMKRYYQDNHDYVYRQLSFRNDDESEVCNGATRISLGRLGNIFVPDGWSLNNKKDNISSGIKAILTKIASKKANPETDLTHLAETPWLVELINKYSAENNVS
jgi:hypothetical protein